MVKKIVIHMLTVMRHRYMTVSMTASVTASVTVSVTVSVTASMRNARFLQLNIGCIIFGFCSKVKKFW